MRPLEFMQIFQIPQVTCQAKANATFVIKKIMAAECSP
jgi:hypothetical protein